MPTPTVIAYDTYAVARDLAGGLIADIIKSLGNENSVIAGLPNQLLLPLYISELSEAALVDRMEGFLKATAHNSLFAKLPGYSELTRQFLDEAKLLSEQQVGELPMPTVSYEIEVILEADTSAYTSRLSEVASHRDRNWLASAALFDYRRYPDHFQLWFLVLRVIELATVEPKISLEIDSLGEQEVAWLTRLFAWFRHTMTYPTLLLPGCEVSS